MTSGTTPKVRLVRCPKCRLVLPEVADVPVYKCGGCETILVAKNRKANVKSRSALQETEDFRGDKLVHVSEHGESSSSTLEEVLPPPSESHLSQESGWNQNISTDSHSEKHAENLSVEGPDDDHCDKDHSTSSASASDSHGEKHVENLSIEGPDNDHYEKDHTTSSARGNDCDKLDERSNEEQQNGLQMESLEYSNVQEPDVPIEGSLSTELHHENEELMLVAEANLEAEANDKTLELESENSELETNNKINSNIGGSSINTPATRKDNLTLMTCEAAGEVISSDNHFPSPNEYLEQPQKSEHHAFDRVRSIDTFATTGYATPSSEFSGPLSKSTTIRSSHAYDGSISSYDGIDDHFSDQKIHAFKNSYKAANYPVPEERHRKEKLPAKGLMNGNSGMQDHARNSSSDFSNKKHHATAKYSKWHRDELLDPEMHHYPPRNWPRLERDDYPSQIPFFQRASLRGYESAGPSRELQHQFPFDSAIHPPEMAEFSEQEKMKFFRMVYELQDQISNTRHLNGKPKRTSTDVPWRQNHLPTYYYQEPPDEENFYPRFYGRHGHRSSWSQQSRFSRIPFSGGAINNRHDIGNSCSCCHPQAWQHSEQLPPPIFRHSRNFCRAHPGHSCYNSYSSCPSSPQRYMESDSSIWSHETKSDDQRYRDHELKRYLREKHHSARRHLRPRAGGAPFVTCYYCFRPLQLPADFLLFKRRFHKLRCGACSKVLKFSLQKGVHIIPYELVAEEPPPSDVEDSSDAINARISNLASCSHGCLQADTSYSDDYGYSFCKSCSTDGDPMEQRRDFVLKHSQNKGKNSMEAFDSAGPSSNMSRSEKVSSQMEELPPRTGGSPLHRLMGYTSPSQVINGFVSSISGTSSVQSDGNSGLDS